MRAVRLHAAIYGQGLSVQMAFQRLAAWTSSPFNGYLDPFGAENSRAKRFRGFDVNQSGLLEPMELCRALRELGFAFDAHEVANWIEAVDTTGNHCADYAEFFAFCKLQVDALMGARAALAADAVALVAGRPEVPEKEVKEKEVKEVASANPPVSLGGAVGRRGGPGVGRRS